MTFRASAEVAAAPSSTPKRVSSRLRSERAPPPPSHADPARMLVFVTPHTSRRAWFIIVLAHSLCAAFVISVGITYLYLRHCVVIEALMLYEVAVDVQYFPEVTAMYFSLGSIHVWFLWDILSRSMCSRTYSLRRASVTTEPSSPSPGGPPTAVYRRAMLQIKEDASGTFRTCSSFLPRVMSTALGSVWSATMACYAAMDVRDQNYGLFFLFRELVQTSLQTYQAYRLSCLVPRVWMNNVIATLLVLNCWSAPLVRYVFPANVGKLRLGCALVSVSLDFVSHVAIPLAISWPHLLQFNTDIGGFGVTSWYTDVWLTQAINELQSLFVASFWDAVSKFLIGSSVARWLYAVTKLIRVATPPVLVVGPSMTHYSAASVAPSPSAASPSEGSAAQPHRPVSWKTRVESGGRHLLLVWGFAVLVLHLYAASLPAYPECLLRTRPWFGTKPSCLLLGYDCMLEKSAGNEEDLGKFLNIFDPDRIGYLVIRRCSLLEMPSCIQSLSQLRGFKLYNSTILRWDSQAALTNRHHPYLLFVFLVEVSMTELPQGLQSADFPKRLMDVEIVRSNVSRLPDTIASNWPKHMFLILESCSFQEVPSVLSILKPSFLSLAMNNISSVPTELLDPASPAVLYLDGNPIAALPSNLTRAPRATWISLVATQVAALSAWIDERFLARSMVLAGNTPFCNRMIRMGLTTGEKLSFQAEVAGLDCYSVSTEDVEDMGFFLSATKRAGIRLTHSSELFAAFDVRNKHYGLDQILRIFYPDSIEHFAIRHCPLLVSPQRIQALHELLGLKVYNSTILEWSEAAAVTNTRYPELRFLFIVETEMRELPIGLQSADFPQRLRDIEFSRTNISAIPDTLDKSWPTGLYVVFEECQLQEFPLVVLRLQPRDAGFALNNITSVPLELLEGYPLRLLLLDGNPISFPTTLAAPLRVLWFDLVDTPISVLPDWMDEAFLASTYAVAANTPLCDRLIAASEANEQEPRPLLARRPPSTSVSSCTRASK